MSERQYRICFISCSAQPLHQSGVSTWIDIMSTALAKRGHEILVFTADFQPKKPLFKQTTHYMNGYRVISVNYPIKIKDYYDFYRDDNVINTSLEKPFKAFIEQYKIQIVHGHALQGMGANLMVVAKEVGCKTILSVHDWWLHCPNMFVTDCFGQPCDTVNMNSEVCGECLARIMQIKGSENLLPIFDAISFWKRRAGYLKWIVNTQIDLMLPVSKTIYQFLKNNELLGQQCQVFESGINRINKKQAVKSKESILTFGYVGGVVKAKGIWLLLDALTKVKSVHWRLFFYGVKKKDQNKELTKYLNDHMSLAQNVYLRGTFNENQKSTVYGELDCLIIPSVCQESYSLAAREALSQGTPVLTSACGGSEEVVVDGVNGWVVERNNAEALAQKIDELIENMEQTKSMRTGAMETEIVYSDNQIEQLKAIYDKV